MPKPPRRRHPILRTHTLLRLRRHRAPMRAPARVTPRRRLLNIAPLETAQVPAQ